MRKLRDLAKDISGATAVEYGLILALVFLAMVGAVQNFAGATTNMWNHVNNEVAAH